MTGLFILPPVGNGAARDVTRLSAFVMVTSGWLGSLTALANRTQELPNNLGFLFFTPKMGAKLLNMSPSNVTSYVGIFCCFILFCFVLTQAATL